MSVGLPTRLLALAVAAAAGLVVLLALSESSSTPSRPSDAASHGMPSAATRGCRHRVDGRPLRVLRAKDTVVGPVAFLGAAETYSHHASRPDSALEPYPGLGMPAMKILALVRAGTSVTLVVPKRQRSWMKLVYGQARRGEYAITLTACRRSRSATERARECGWRPYRACRSSTTQFSGGFGLDFARAPKRGRCAELVVWLEGRRRPLRTRLFKPSRGACLSPSPGVRELDLEPAALTAAVTVRDRRHALRFRLPPGWRHGEESLTPRLAPPGGILAVATFPPRANPRAACGSAPDMPQVAVGPRDALLHAEEEGDAQPADLPRRPNRFRLSKQVRRPGANEPVSTVFRWPCLNRRGIVGLHTSFRAHGRLLHVAAVAGERTSKRVRRELLGILASLRIGPPPPVPVSVSPGIGGPETTFRLEVVAGERTGRQGRRERRYWAEVRGPERIACVINHDTFFPHGPLGVRLKASLDPTRTKGGRWCRGRFRGVVRYRDGFVCPPAPTCRVPPNFPTERRVAGRFGFVVR